MATFAAILGLRVKDIQVENIATTSKTLPQFPQMWSDLKQVLTTLGRAAPSRSSTGAASSTNGD